MTWFLGIFGLFLFTALSYLLIQPKRYSVKRCITIEQPVDIVFNKIRDLPSWKDWSPWVLHEPNTQLTYSEAPNEVGGSYSWQGEMIGSGSLTHVAFSAPSQIQQKIEFIKPFQSTADISWDLTAKEHGCEICWSMQGQLPFLFRFLNKKMTSMIGNDFELGLALLNGQLDSNADSPKISFDGEVMLDEKSGLHRRFAGNIEEMQQVMGKQFQEMLAEVEREGYSNDGVPATIYHKSKPKTAPTWFEIDMFVPVSDAPKQKTAKRPGGKYFQVTLLGDYAFLKLAWHSAFANLQMKGYKFDWPRVPFESYENCPTDVEHSNQIKTIIYIPIK